MKRLTRREVLKKAARTAGVAAVAPYIVPASALGRGALPPSERTTVGVIGCGGMGRGHVMNFKAVPEAHVAAVCDVDPARIQRLRREQGYGGPAYTDFREMLAREDLDAVSIATPHHSHAWITIACAKAGKDIYCEKPLTHTIAEGRAVVDAVKRYGRVFQVGTQRRTWSNHRLCSEFVRNERMGKLKHIFMRMHPRLAFVPHPTAAPSKPPKGFDWDLWLGPAPWVPFSKDRGHWNNFSDYSAGGVTLMGSHIFDIVVWAAGPFLHGPVEIEPVRPLEDKEGTYQVKFRFADGVTIFFDAVPWGKTGNTGARFEGTDGHVWIDVYANRHETKPASILQSPTTPDEIHLHSAKDNWADFIRAVRTRGPTLCPVETGHQMTTLCHLVWIAMYLGRKVTWDMEKEQFINDAQADRLRHYAYRSPYRLA